MRRLAESLLAWVPFDARSRRALDETLLDWAHEQAEARTLGRRAMVEARAMLALARTLVLAAAIETWRVPIGWFASRLLVVLVLPALLFNIIDGWSYSDIVSWPVSMAALLLMVPMTASVLAPVCFFYLAVWTPRRRPVPTIGVALAAVAVTLVLGGWLAPAANQAFRVLIYTQVTGRNVADASAALGRGLPETALPQLFGKASQSPTRAGAERAIGLITQKIGVSIAAGTFVLLGAGVMRLARRRALWCCLVLPGATVAFSLATAGGVAGGMSRTVALGLATWLLAIAALVTAARLPAVARPASG